MVLGGQLTGAERQGKRSRARRDQVRIKEMNASEPLMKHRKHVEFIKTNAVTKELGQSTTGVLLSGCTVDGVQVA